MYQGQSTHRLVMEVGDRHSIVVYFREAKVGQLKEVCDVILFDPWSELQWVE